MSGENFKFPPGMRSAAEWSQGQSYIQADILAIQRDAARREVQTMFRAIETGEGVPGDYDHLQIADKWKEVKPCHCVFTPHPRETYDRDGVRMCGYCDRPIL